MKIYDISQEIFNSQVYPGHPSPEKSLAFSLEKGDEVNLTKFTMGAHNGTHIDAPCHFIQGGKSVDDLSLYAFVGKAYVTEHDGTLTGEDATAIINKAKACDPEAAKRILIKGDVEVSLDAAKVFSSSEVLLLGNEPQAVGPKINPTPVHLVLLGADIVPLEGIRLDAVSEGVYFLNAAPLNLSGADGAPCRAILIDFEG